MTTWHQLFCSTLCKHFSTLFLIRDLNSNWDFYFWVHCRVLFPLNMSCLSGNYSVNVRTLRILPNLHIQPNNSQNFVPNVCIQPKRKNQFRWNPEKRASIIAENDIATTALVKAQSNVWENVLWRDRFCWRLSEYRPNSQSQLGRMMESGWIFAPQSAHWKPLMVRGSNRNFFPTLPKAKRSIS